MSAGKDTKARALDVLADQLGSQQLARRVVDVATFMEKRNLLTIGEHEWAHIARGERLAIEFRMVKRAFEERHRDRFLNAVRSLLELEGEEAFLIYDELGDCEWMWKVTYPGKI